MPRLGKDRNDFLTIKFFFSPFLTHIIKCLFIMATNCLLHCNAYKRPETWESVALFNFRMWDHREHLLNKGELQNLSSRIELTRLLEKCSCVQFGHMWHFGRLWEVYVEYDVRWLPIQCQVSRFLSTVSLECLLECLSHLVSALQAAWLFVSVKVPVPSMEHRLADVRFSLCWSLRCRASGSVSSTENVQFYFYRISF